MKPPRTHDLKLLREKCERFDKHFEELLMECIRLNEYSSQPRYPNDMEITEDDMHTALKDSEAINTSVKLRMELLK